MSRQRARICTRGINEHMVAFDLEIANNIGHRGRVKLRHTRHYAAQESDRNPTTQEVLGAAFLVTWCYAFALCVHG